MNITGRPPVQKLNPVVPGLRNEARGQQCTLRIPGLCRRDPDYTVGMHPRLFGIAGMGEKPHDMFIIDGCDRCHSIFDSRDKWAAAGVGWDDVLRALMETQTRRLQSGWAFRRDQ